MFPIMEKMNNDSTKESIDKLNMPSTLEVIDYIMNTQNMTLYSMIRENLETRS